MKSIRPFHSVPVTFWWVGWLMFNFMNKVLQASWVTAKESFLNKSLQKEIRWHKVWELWWPNTVPNNAITKEILQGSLCCFRSMGCHSILLKPAISYILFQHIYELSRKILIIFCVNCLFQKQWYYSLLSRYCTPNWIFEEWKAFSRIPHSTVLTINASTQVEASVVCKKNCPTRTPSCIKELSIGNSEFLQLYHSLHADRNLMSLISAVCVLCD
jgi:hypothetical protein